MKVSSSTNPAVAQLREDYPLMWTVALNVDYNERMGFSNSVLDCEIAEALHEIWLARCNRQENNW